MQSLNLNFFGEKIDINIPKTLSDLRQSIASSFAFDLNDVSEFLITYTKDLKRFIIKTEEDFRKFISNKIFKIDLDIDEQSRIYQTNKKELQENKDMLKKLEIERKNIIDNNNKEILKGKEKIKEIKKKILEYQKEIQTQNKKLIKIHKDNVQLLKNKEKEINELRKTLNLSPIKTQEEKKKPKKPEAKPIKTKEKKVETNPELNNLFKKFIDSIPQIQEIIKDKIINKPETNKPETKKDETNKPETKKDKNTEKKPVHYCVRCDGCNCFPIRGIRYKCAVCNNFDYCEDCEEKYYEVHQHPFIKINKPELAPKKIQVILPENMPEFKK